MLGVFYNKMEASQDEKSKVPKKRSTQPQGTVRYGRHKTMEASKSTWVKNDQQALKSQACRYRARNVVSVVGQSITEQAASSLSQPLGSSGQRAALASSAGLNGFSEGSPNLKLVKHAQSLPRRDGSAGSASRSRGRGDRSGGLQSKIQMKHTQSLLANKGNKRPLIMEISPDPNLLLQQRPVQLSQANKAQIKLVNQAGGTARSFQAQLNGNLLKTKQKSNPDEALRPVLARNNRSPAERMEVKKSTSKRKNASSSLVGTSKSGQGTEPGLYVGGLTPDGLSRAAADAKATTLQTPASFDNHRKTEGNVARLAPETVRHFDPVATPLRTAQVENDRMAGAAAIRDSRIGSDQSNPHSPLQPCRNKTSKPRQPNSNVKKREKKVLKKHANTNSHALSMSPSQMRPEWCKGKTPLIQTVKYRAEPNNNKGQTNFPVYANEFGQSLDGGIQSSTYVLPRQEKDNLCTGSNAPMLNQQAASMSPLMTSLSSQNVLAYQQSRPVQPPQEQQRAPIPPMINITRKAVQSPHRGAEFRKTLTEIGDKSKKRWQGSNNVSDGDVAAVHHQENVNVLKRISEIAEEQHTHAASLAEMPVQNLVEEKRAPILLKTQADDHQQAPVGDALEQLDYKSSSASGLPSRTHRTYLEGQLCTNPRGEHVQIQSNEEDLDEPSSHDGAAPLQNSSLTPDSPRRLQEERQHKGSYDPISIAMLQSINANSGSIQGKSMHIQDEVDGTPSKTQNLVNRTAYFDESSEAMGTPHGRHELQQLLNEKQQEQVPDGSPVDNVAPGPGGAELGRQRTRITIVTAPAARKQQRQTQMGPPISSSQDASMFRSNGSIGATVPMRNSDYGQTPQARTEDHRDQPNENHQGSGSVTVDNERRDIESAQNPSPRFVYRNSVEYHAGQTSKDTFLSGGEKSAQNQLRFTLADSANADDHLVPAKGRPSQVDDSADPTQQLNEPGGSYETQGATETPNRMTKKQVHIGSNYSSVDQAALSRPELIISNQGKPILKVKTKQFKPNQVEPSQRALEKQPQHLKSKSLPEAGIPESPGNNIKINDQAAPERTPAGGAESDGVPQLQETGDAHGESSSNSESVGAGVDDSGLDDDDKDGKDDDMGEIKMKDGKETCIGKINELWAEFLFRPSSAFKIKWDIIVIILSIWNSIEIPFEFAFPESFEGAETVNAVDKMIDALFVFDILVNFRTMYVDPKTDLMIEDPRKISKNYVQGRFWIDLVASIPFEVFAVFFENDDGTSGNETTLKIFGMLKLVRLMRLGRMVSFMKTNKSFKLSIILVQLLFILILVIHWIACIWYGVIGLEDGNTWIPPKDVDWDSTIIYTETDFQIYNVFFYYSVLTLVTNELMPTNNIEILSAICILLTGSLVIGILIGEFSSIMSDMSETANRQNEELDMMTSVMMGLKLPEEIQLNVLDYYLALQSCKYVHNDQVYDYLNKCITNTIKHFQVEHWVIQSQLVHEDNQSLILQFASLTTMEYFQQNEIVIKQNDLSDNFYLICEGIVEVAQEAGDFQYYDYSKKKKFLEKQMVINQRRKNLSQRRSSQRRKAGVEFDEITKFQNVMDIKPFFANSKDSREEEGSGEARPSLPKANQEDTSASASGFRIINELTAGDYFGEISMVTNLRRTCSVYTVSNGYFAVIEKARFLELANANVDLKHKLYNKINSYNDENFKASVTMIKNVPSFRPLNQLCLRKLVYRLRDERYARGQKILRTGEHCDKVYFVKSGRVQVYVKDMSESSNQHRWHKLTTLKAGDCFNFVGAVLQRPAIFEFVSETLPGLNVTAQHEQRSMQREAKGFTEQQLEESEVSYRDSERSQDREAVDILSGDDQQPGESQPLGAGTNEAAKEAKYEGGQPEAPSGTSALSQSKRTQPSNDGQRHLPPTDSARWQSAGLGSKELINCDKLNQQIGAEAGLAESSGQFEETNIERERRTFQKMQKRESDRQMRDAQVAARRGTQDRNGHTLAARAGSVGQEEAQARSNPQYPRVVQATSHHKTATMSAGSQPSSISRMISRSLNFSQEPGENEKGAAPPWSSEPDDAFGATADEEQSRGEYEVLDNTAQLYSLSRTALMELADMDEHIHNAIVNVKNIYRGQHIKYDYSTLLYKNTKELTVAQHAKDMQEYNEFGELDSHFFFCTSFLQKLKMQMLRKKILKFAKFMLHRNIKMNDVEVFKHVDANYHHFVGRDKNLPLNLILHNGFYNQTSQGKLFKFIEKINEKNSEAAKTATPAEKMDERDLNMNKDKSVFDNEKEYSQFSKQTALNVNTLRRYKEQEHFQQNLINKPAEALERILEQAIENVQNVDIVRQNVEELHFENYYKLTQLEKWVDKIATQYRTVVQKREGSQRGVAAGLQPRQIGQAAGNFNERQGHQALTSACAGSTSQTLKPLPESAEYHKSQIRVTQLPTHPSQDAENDNLDQDFALTSPEKTKAMTLAEFKEIEKQAEDLDIDSMLRDVEDIEKKIRKTINQSVAEQEKISVERHLTERRQRHAVDAKQYYDSSKEKSASPRNKSNNYQKSQNAASGLTGSPEKGQRFTSGTQNNGNFQDKQRTANIPERGRSQEPKKPGQSREPNRQPTHSSRGANSKESDFHGPAEIVASPKVGNSVKRETNAAFHSPRRQRASGNQVAEDANASQQYVSNVESVFQQSSIGHSPMAQVRGSIAASNVLDQSGSLHRNAAVAGPVPIPSSTLRSAALAGLGNVPNLNNTNGTHMTNESGQHTIMEMDSIDQIVGDHFRASLGSQHPGVSGRQERTARVDLDLNKFYSDSVSQPNGADAAESRFVHTLDSQPSHRSHNPSFSFQVAADGHVQGSPGPADRARVIKTQSSRDSQHFQYKK